VSSLGRKCPAGEIQVCERQQREHLGPVLGDAAIAHLAIAELALQGTKHMLDICAHLAEPVIAGTLAGGQHHCLPDFRNVHLLMNVLHRDMLAWPSKTAVSPSYDVRGLA
jgi:hypothetical protein